MQNLKINDSQIETLTERLREANRVSAAAAKEIETCKKLLGDKLKALRGLDVNALPIGSIVAVNACLLIEIASMCKFDERKFSAEHPALHESFKRDIPVRKFKPVGQ